MKIKINRNTLWTETFVNELVSNGVKYACISPGSRNTPLTLAFANNKNIKSYLHIDERSGGFFALGLAKASQTPVALICTSGTATAEFYPAIIEAYQQRIPLVVCTADRPPELLDCGANQTINQNNIYRNHIRWFFDVGLPEPISKRIKHIKAIAKRAVFECSVKSPGPVHLNFPFRKPFEPEAYTNEVDNDIIKIAKNISVDNKKNFIDEEKNITVEKWFIEIFDLLIKKKKGLIIAGPENYDSQFHASCKLLSEKLNYPIFADGASQLRFGKSIKTNIISNFDALLRSDKFVKKNQPEIIIQFGRTVTSKSLETFLENTSAIRFMINEFGDWFDPSNKAQASFACKPYMFCQKMFEKINMQKNYKSSTKWRDFFSEANLTASKIKKEIIENSTFPNEARIVNELLNALPGGTQIMISNSMPIRDFDYFASKTEKNFTIFNNRGASGIDGINSTALGIAAVSKIPTILLTGDLAFYHDLNGLLAAKKYSIPLIIVLINNNGGGIFEVLPISNYGKIFKEYFIAPHDLDFEIFIKGYSGNYHLIKSWKDLNSKLKSSLKKKNFSVLEIQTNAEKSLQLRRKYWTEVDKNLFNN
ncbi:MAG: 2-succinyl-5-enolpyruvyl-6-hydroxy-3-cyclohexene-1-carboxylic-acid synthase [Ignavibacteriaceae bacterium]